jgi:hypothetical protein
MYVLSSCFSGGVIDNQLPSIALGDDTLIFISNAIIAHRRILGKIHSVSHTHSGTSVPDAEITVLEQEVHDWRASWPISNDQASQTFAQLLSLQALCLLLRPTPIKSKMSDDQKGRLDKYAKEALAIYQNSTNPPRDLITLAWRYQIVITVLYTAIQSDTNQDLIRAQIEICRQVIGAGSELKELEKLKGVFEQLAILSSRTIAGGEMSSAADRILADLYAPQLHVSEEKGKRGQTEELRLEYMI